MGVLGTPVKDHAEAMEQEEQEGKADGDNGAGEECIKWEIDGKRRQRGTRRMSNVSWNIYERKMQIYCNVYIIEYYCKGRLQ